MAKSICGQFLSNMTSCLCRLVVIVPLSIIVSLLLPTILIVLICPLLGYRLIVSLIYKYVDPSLVKFVPPVGALLSAHTPYSNPVCTLLLPVYVSETVDRSVVVQTIEDQIITPNLYPELQHQIVTRFGFQFWKESENFSVENHVKWYRPEHKSDVGPSEVASLLEKLVKAPFNSSRSPWEFVLVKRYKDEKNPKLQSVIIFRGHHCFLDGHSIFSLLAKLSKNGIDISSKVRPSQKASRICAILKVLLAPLIMSYELLQYALSSDKNVWTEASTKSPKGHIRIRDSAPIPMSTLKDIKAHHGVSMTCLVMTLFLGGFIKMMRRRGEYISNARLNMPVPKMNHPDKLENHFSGCALNVKIYEYSILKTMHRLEKELFKLKSFPGSVKIWGFPKIANVVGRLPTWFMSDPNTLPASTFVVSNFQGPEGKVDVFGYPVEELGCSATPTRNTSIVTNALSYNGFFKYTLFGDSSVFPNEDDLELFLSGIADTVNELLV